MAVMLNLKKKRFLVGNLCQLNQKGDHPRGSGMVVVCQGYLYSHNRSSFNDTRHADARSLLPIDPYTVSTAGRLTTPTCVGRAQKNDGYAMTD